MTTKDKTIKLISALLIISFIVPTVLLSRPKQAEAQWYTFSVSDFWNALTSGSSATTATTNSAKLGLAVKDAAKEILKQAAMTVARRALQEVTKSTINWINTGFHGSPLFLENPESFFEDIAKSEIRNIVDIFGYDTHRYPFGKSFALGVINSYKSTLEDNTAYSLSKVFNDPQLERNYQNDFNVGGWNGFITNTQYPQNNYLGFQMKATEELARRVQGTGQGPAAKVREALAQGGGFLSPKACPANINPNYNNGINEWRQPSFDEGKFESDYARDVPKPLCEAASEEECSQLLQEWDHGLTNSMVVARTRWAQTHECKKSDGSSGLVNTTPGSVVADQIKINLGSGVRQKELAAAMGNSLSAVFDALINKFIGDGLNSLASTINPPPENEDTWNYEGLTLGSSEYGTNVTWDSLPDIEIGLDEFKKQLSGRTIVTTIDGETGATTTKEEIGNTGNGTYIPGDIANTQKEIQLMNELTSYFSQIWPEARKLDICIPGPDMGWQDRLQSEVLRNSQKLQKLQAEDNASKSAEADSALKELKFAVDFFKDWINNKMITELPNSIFYIEAVEDVKTLPQQSTELQDAKRVKAQGLARLQAIQTALNTIKEAPAGSAQEKTLISLKKQYDGTRLLVSNSSSLNERQNTLDVAKDKLANMKTLLPACETERKAKGWGTPGGAISSYSGPSVISSSNSQVDGLPINSEQAIFCSLPIKGGYNHETFRNETGVTHPEIPMVNAKKILEYRVTNAKSILSTPGLFRDHSKAAYVNIQLSCKAIFNAKLLDYKGNLPGLTTVTETSEALPDDSGITATGTCEYPEDVKDEDVTEENCELNEGVWTPYNDQSENP